MNAQRPPLFIVGQTYMDREGDYMVITIVGDRVICERPNGERCEGNASVKARIHQNILSEQGANHASTSLRHRKISFSGNRPRGFTHKEVFPLIAEMINAYANISPEYFEHDDLASMLPAHPDLGSLFDQLVALDPQGKSMTWWASNMLDFFSKVWTIRSPHGSSALSA